MSSGSRLQGPAWDRAHAAILRERVMPDGSGWTVTDAGRFFRPVKMASHEWYRLADECKRKGDEELERELAESLMMLAEH